MKKHGKLGSKKGSTTAGTASESILESMRCPVCTELLLSPIYQCERGHNICSLCIEEVHECPLCKGDYGDTRNYFAEDLVNSIVVPCKFAEYGCSFTCLGSQLRDHQENCEFQPYRCPELACQELIGQGQMAKHLEQHGFKIVVGESHMATFDIKDNHFDTKTEYNPWRTQTFGREFYTVASRQRDKNWYFWAWILALPKEAKKYSCEIILASSRKQVLYRGGVHSLRTAPEDIIKGAQALVLTDQVIKAFREDGKITCKVRFIEGKNWDKTTKEKKPLSQAKKENRKNLPKVKGKGSQAHTITSYLKRTPSSSSTLTALKAKTSKIGIGSAAGALLKVLTTPKVKLAPSKTKTSSTKKPVVTDAEQSLILKIRESLMCPGCQDSISPPILLCSVGHSVCDTCRIKYSNNCPLCRSPITGTRNFFAEELLYKTVQKCRFHTSGCDVSLPAVQIRLHEETCEFAPYECPFSTCRRVFEPKDLLDHMKTHDIPMVKNEVSMPIPFPKSTSAPICAIPSILLSQGIAFYPLVLRETNGMWTFWVASNDAANYVYELRIKKQSKILAFQGHVCSLRLSPTQIVLRGEGLITTEKAIKSFRCDDKFEFGLKIAPIKGYTKSGVSFLSPPILANKVDSKISTKTELFANRRTSRMCISNERRDSDDDYRYSTTRLVPRRHRPQSYNNLFTSDGEDDDDEDMGSSPDSKSSSSIKKSKSGQSLCSDDESDIDSISEDLILVNEIIASETSSANASFDAVELRDETGAVGGGEEPTDLENPTGEEEKHIAATKDAEKKPLVKSKSALKLKEKNSKEMIRLKESASLKKVEFNLPPKIFAESSASAEQSGDENNNSTKLILDEGIEVETIAQVLTPTVVSTSSEPVLTVPPVIPANTETPKFNSKVEIYSRSCTDLKNCGSRDSMKSKIQQLSSSLLGAIREEDENNGGEMEDIDGPWRPVISTKGKERASIDTSVQFPLLTTSPELTDVKEGNNVALGKFGGPIEVTVRTEDKIAFVSLSSVAGKSESSLTVRGTSSDGSIISNFDFEVPINSTGSTELVDEVEMACQVGSSLTRMAKDEPEDLNNDSSNILELTPDYSRVAGGISNTYLALKNIISGIIQPSPSVPMTGNGQGNDAEHDFLEAPPVIARLPDNYGKEC